MSEPMLVAEAAAGDRKRIAKLLVAAAVVLVAALVLPGVLFGGGGGDDDLAEFEASLTSPQTTAAPEPTEDVTDVVAAFSTRNPFTPLVSPAVAPATTPAVPTGEQPAVATPDVVIPDLGTPIFEVPVTPTPTAPPTTVAPAPAPAPGPGEARFALAEVFQDPAGQVLARVRINDVVHEVVVGRDFAEHYRFVSADLATRCASFLFGDTRFELCEGEETRP